MSTPTVADAGTLTHWIGGQAVAPSDGERFGEVRNPATGEVIDRVPLADQAVVDRAVTTAQDAFLKWRKTSSAKRGQIMFEFRDLLRKRQQDLAQSITTEQGKTAEDALGGLQRALATVELCCNVLASTKGEYSEQIATDLDAYSFRQPLGVCAGITPFNFPSMIPIFMSAVAISTGNTFILKPSEQVPRTPMLLAEIYADAGVPSGVFNIVHGDKVAVDAILDHPGIAAVSFIGSTPVARHVYERAAANGKRVQALGGAKNHMVVLPDADIDFAADSLVSAAYGAAGQRCMAVTTAVAVGSAGDELVAKTRDRLTGLRVGPGDDPKSDMGPLISPAAKERVLGYVERGVAAGAELVVDGRGVKVDGYENGNFVGGCLFDRVTPDMELYQKEIFGPVLIVLRVDSFDEALELVNTNEYGNGAAIFTRSGAAARHFQEEVRAGTVGVNVPIPFPISAYGFGGWDNSRFGDHGINYDAFRFYTQAKVVTSRWKMDKTGLDMAFLRSV